MGSEMFWLTSLFCRSQAPQRVEALAPPPVDLVALPPAVASEVQE